MDYIYDMRLPLQYISGLYGIHCDMWLLLEMWLSMCYVASLWHMAYTTICRCHYDMWPLMQYGASASVSISGFPVASSKKAAVLVIFGLHCEMFLPHDKWLPL